jgi:hypothetical protein
MNKQTQEALQMAMRFAKSNILTRISGLHGENPLTGQEVFDACKEALSEQEPAIEPVGWYWNSFKGNEPHCDVKRGSSKLDHIFGEPIPLYTHPKQWQGLTDDEVEKMARQASNFSISYHEFAHAIEQALKEKNHGN